MSIENSELSQPEQEEACEKNLKSCGGEFATNILASTERRLPPLPQKSSYKHTFDFANSIGTVKFHKAL